MWTKVLFLKGIVSDNLCLNKYLIFNGWFDLFFFDSITSCEFKIIFIYTS